MAIEAKRGCGYRKVGGLYLVAGKEGVPCHRLPFPLDVCPTCNAGIKQSRGWTWVDGEKLLVPACDPAKAKSKAHCLKCPVCLTTPLKKAGLIWIGERFYSTPGHFAFEASTMGVSRRVGTIPRGFKLGETWVLLAHSKAVVKEEVLAPGIFQSFKPERIELLITKSDATKKKLAELKERGITPVIVPDNDKDHQGSVYDNEEEDDELDLGGDQ